MQLNAQQMLYLHPQQFFFSLGYTKVDTRVDALERYCAANTDKMKHIDIIDWTKESL